MARYKPFRGSKKSWTSRSKYLEDTYGISEEDYQRMYKLQKGVCAICKRNPDRLCVDHDHSTKVVRGLLCRSCNYGLGVFKDNPQWLRRAAAYLKKANDENI